MEKKPKPYRVSKSAEKRMLRHGQLTIHDAKRRKVKDNIL